jgi:hypothetical protein
MGLPKMISGNFASVFPMISASGHKYAVKCFTRAAPNQLQRYSIIGTHLNKLQPKWATDFQFIQKGIQVDDSRYPILLMNWVSGVTLTRWVSDNVDGRFAIADLARRFDHMVHDLATSGMAHGDLQSGNLLIGDNGALFLVDYDGMYVPGLDALPAGETGHPDYQPPGRSQADYGPAMDHFSAWLISLSLKILAADPGLWDKLNPAHDEYLLLDRRDLLDMGSSSRFSVLSSHRDAEVRRLAQIMRSILTLPLAAIPSPASLSAGDSRTPDSASEAPPTSGIPDWMRSYVSKPERLQGQSNGISFSALEGQHGAIRSRQHTWLVRSLIALPLVAIVGVVWDWRISLAMCATAIYLVTLSLWHLYRRHASTLTYAELRRARRKADSAVSRAAGKIPDAQQEKAKSERSLQRLVNQHAKKRASIQANFGDRQRKVSRKTDSIDRKLSQLVARKQSEIGRRLKQYQQNYVKARLSQAIIDASQISGVGAQLVADLRSAGIRSAADFTGITLMSNGRSATVHFHLASGGQIHIPGIGEVKARKIDQWRQAQLAIAMRYQPSALAASDLHAINAQFAAEERRLHEERVRIVKAIADRVAAIQRDLDFKLADIDKRHQIDLIPVNQRIAELAARLGRAYSDHLAAEKQLTDWDRRLAAAVRPKFSRFVIGAIRGVDL